MGKIKFTSQRKIYSALQTERQREREVSEEAQVKLNQTWLEYPRSLGYLELDQKKHLQNVYRKDLISSQPCRPSPSLRGHGLKQGIHSTPNSRPDHAVS